MQQPSFPPVHGRPSLVWETQPSPCLLCAETRAIVVGQRDRRGNPLRTVLCYRCGLVRVCPPPELGEHRDFYSGLYRIEYRGASTPSLRHVFRNTRAACERLPWLKRALPSPAKVLDVGSGSGEFVSLLLMLGYEATGVEADPAYAEFARSMLRAPVTTGFLEDGRVPERQFDCVTAFHVIEHVFDPVQFLVILRRLVRPGGKLLLEAPDVESPFPRGNRRFHRAHLHYFSLESLAACVAAAGWSKLECGRSWDGGNLFLLAQESGAARQLPDSPQGPASLQRFRDAMRAAAYYGSPVLVRRLQRQVFSRAMEWFAAAVSSGPEQVFQRAAAAHFRPEAARR